MRPAAHRETARLHLNDAIRYAFGCGLESPCLNYLYGLYGLLAEAKAAADAREVGPLHLSCPQLESKKGTSIFR
jgi:hypothetical protein